MLDWGLARRIHQKGEVTPVPASTSAPPPHPREALSLRTRLESVVGTPLYMSPEQARGEHDVLDERSDTYSLAVLFHEFLFLRRWFLARGFAKDPARRYQSVDEMVAGLQRLMDGRIAVLCQRTLLECWLHKALRLVDQRPLAVMFGSTAAAALVLAALGHLVWTLLD